VKQKDLVLRGHAIEARIYAENPVKGFLPSTGTLRHLRAPEARDGIVRVDSGVRQGDAISPHYDPMIAKLIVWGDDRPEAARRMQSALAETALLGVKTNLAFLERVLAHPAYLAGDTDTGFIERHRADLLPSEAQVPVEALVAAAARVFMDEQRSRADAPASPWNDTGGWRLNQPALRRMEFVNRGQTTVSRQAENRGLSPVFYRFQVALSIFSSREYRSFRSPLYASYSASPMPRARYESVVVTCRPPFTSSMAITRCSGFSAFCFFSWAVTSATISSRSSPVNWPLSVI
jgi:acetyl/propionyl-CoA carboxylase alpha subunit